MLSIALKNGIIIILIILVIHHLLNISLKKSMEPYQPHPIVVEQPIPQSQPQQQAQQQQVVKDELFEFLFKGGMQESPMPMPQQPNQAQTFSTGVFDSSSANKMFSNLDGYDDTTGFAWAPV